MDLVAIIKELVEEKELVERAILSVERISLQRGKRRGRPPAWMAIIETPPKKRRGRPPGKKSTAK